MTKLAEPVEVVPDGIAPPDRRFWLAYEDLPVDRFGLPVPRFNVIQTASFFFARSNSWLRAFIRQGQFVLDGEPLVFSRIPRFVQDEDTGEFKPAERAEGEERNDPRYFSLADVERMAYALAQQGSISEHTLMCAIQLVKWEARIHGILKD